MSSHDDSTKNKASKNVAQLRPDASPRDDNKSQFAAERNPKSKQSDQQTQNTKHSPAPQAYPYENVHVLLIGWEADIDGAFGELQALQDVFKNTYNFEVEDIFAIPSEYSEQVLLDTLRGLNAEYSPRMKDALLIIGYVGHGKMIPDRSYKIATFSEGDTCPWNPSNPQLNWSVIQEELQTMDNDILIIMDACFSASVVQHIDTAKCKNKMEILVACGYNEKAWGPERARTFWNQRHTTFSRQLATVLRSMAGRNPGFSVAELHLKLVQEIIGFNFEKRVTGEVLPTPVHFTLGRTVDVSSIPLKVLKSGRRSGVYRKAPASIEALREEEMNMDQALSDKLKTSLKVKDVMWVVPGGHMW